MKMINQYQAETRGCSINKNAIPYKTCIKQRHKISQPFSEQDIIWLQELFLTNEWHCLQVNDIKAGRSIINTMLYSLNYYHDVACLTVEDCPQLGSNCYDVYLQAFELGYLGCEPYDLEEFLIENFHSDFLWVEETQKLIKTSWYQQFLQALQDLQMVYYIPIIIVTY